MKKITLFCCLIALCVFSDSVLAKCKSTYHGHPGRDRSGGVPLNFGTVHLMPEEFQPDSIVGVVHASIGQAQALSDGGNTLMFECDIADRGQIFEAFATNGDSNVGGFHEYPSGSGIYQTFFPRTGIKITRDKDGKVFSRLWQRSPIDGTIENGKLHIYARDFSDVTAELYKLDRTMRTRASHHFGCRGPAEEDYQGPYTCPQPNAYTVFVGPGWNEKKPYYYPQDSDRAWSGFSTSRWIGIGMNYARPNLIQTTFSCRLLDYTKVVMLPAVSAKEVKSGNMAGAPFTIKYRCNNLNYVKRIDSLAGVGNGKISVAFMTKSRHKEYPGSAPVQYLLSDNYGQDGYAQNVGIGITPFNKNTNLGFIQEKNPGDYKNWFSILEGEQQRTRVNSTSIDITSQFRAYYAPLAVTESQPVTPGKVDATAYILVRYQ